MKPELSCEEVQKNIPDFIDTRMDSKESLAFIRHIRNCKACMEELSVEYLVVVGVKRLDSASAFNLNMELEELISKNEKKAKRRQNISLLIFMAAILSAVVGGYFLSRFFLMR
ncbi:MAG: zf-HC2 domain-containing protein [Lachnospiraceae bacterium]|nr:zf-HC2 domain-containing protein [Lachnospiraceae bacterium]